MSTSNKLTYLNGTKQLLKQKINNLGGSIDDNTTFRQYANQLQNVYDNLPKTEYQEGTEINLGVTSKGKLDYENGVVGIGQSEQDSTTGTNLANTLGYIAPTTTNGITYSLENNIISLNGTSTASFYINFPGKFDLASGNYTFAPADISGTYTGVCGKYPCVNGTDIFDGNQLSTLVNRTLNSDYTDVFIRLFVSNGSSYSNYKCKLNLVKGTYTSQTIPTWEKYSGGYASPNPSYPQEIKCVRGWNILKDTGWERKTASSDVTQIQDSTTRIMSDYIEVDENLNYYATIQSTNYCFINVVLYNANKVQFSTYYNAVSETINGTRSIELNFPTNTKYVRVVVRNADNTSEVTLDELAVIKPQLEQSSTPHSYLPYNTIEEVVSGKNLLNPTEIKDASINSTIGDTITYYSSNASKTYVKCAYVKQGVAYTFSKKPNTPSSSAGRIIDIVDDNEVILEAFSILPSETSYTYTPSHSGWVYMVVDVNATEIMVRNSSITDDTYEPYITPTSYQLSLGDKKLYEGDYLWINKTTGKKYHHHSKTEYAFTGQEGFTKSQAYPGGYYRGWDLMNGKNNAPYLCTHAKYVSSLSDYVVGTCYSDSSCALRLGDGEELPTTDSFKTLLAQLYANGTPVTIVYQLATETDEEITGTLAEQLNAWYNAHSLNGTTIITSNGELPMIIKVRALKGES